MQRQPVARAVSCSQHCTMMRVVCPVCFMPQTSVMSYPITVATQTMIKPKRTCVLTSAIGDIYAASVVINDQC